MNATETPPFDLTPDGKPENYGVAESSTPPEQLAEMERARKMRDAQGDLL